MPRSKLDSVGARKLVSTTVKKWKTAYMFTIKEEEVGSGGGSGSGGAGGGAGASTAGRFRFLVIASKPTATRPIPECVVNVYVNVDATKGADDVVLTYSSKQAMLQTSNATDCLPTTSHLLLTAPALRLPCVTPPQQLRMRHMCTLMTTSLASTLKHSWIEPLHAKRW